VLLIENIIVALQSLRASPLRSALTLIGMAVGIGAVLYVVVLGEATQERINERLESMGSNVLQIRPGNSRLHGVRTGSTVVNLEWADAREIASSSNVITVTVPVSSQQTTVEYEGQSWTTKVTGTTPDYEDVDNDHPIEGRFFSQEELNRRARVCVLGATVQEQLFGTESPIGESVLVNFRRFEVVGLLGTKGESWSSPDDQVFIPLTTAQERLFGTTYLSSILAQMRSSDDLDEALFDIETVLRRNHRLREDQEDDFRVMRQDFFLTSVQQTNEDIANFIILVALVSLVVGGIGIANVMLVSVTERVREIGIRRAIGARRLHILTQFLIESMILGVMGGILGIVGGLLFNHFTITSEFIIPWHWIGYSFLICAGIGGASGLYPAFRAANENVINALAYE
jgi:putative ABC transport system permease protein